MLIIGIKTIVWSWIDIAYVWL